MIKNIWAILLTYSCFALESFIDPTVYHNPLGSYYVPNNQGHRPVIELIKAGKIHEVDTLKYIQEHYEEGTSIVHAGTYFGDMLPFFASLASKATVWAFEPVWVNYCCAFETLKLNRLSNVKLFHRGLSNQTALMQMEVCDQDGPRGGASRIVQEAHHAGIESIRVTTIDEVLKNNQVRISLIHLDIEGHEIQALKGALKTIEKYRPVIILEVFKKHLAKTHAFMKKLGYTYERRIDCNCVYIPKNRGR